MSAAFEGKAPVAPRLVALRRRTRETDISLRLDLDPEPGAAPAAGAISTGIGFLDHLLGSLAFHARWSLELSCAGDLAVDEHHSAEDCALLLGEALARALDSGPPIRRFGWAFAPLDEALARAVVDLSGRPFARVRLGLGQARLGGLAGENAEHFAASLAMAARMTLHLDLLRGENAHHRAEAAFKALALALRGACRADTSLGASAGGSSTKGLIIVQEDNP